MKSRFIKGILTLGLLVVLSINVLANNTPVEVRIPFSVADIEVLKATGKAEGLTTTIVLEAEEGALMPNDSTKVTKTVGYGVSDSFDAITYTEPGEHKYKVYQEYTEKEGWYFDDSVFEVTVQVLSDDKGVLTSNIVVNKEGKKVDLKFENMLEAQGDKLSDDRLRDDESKKNVNLQQDDSKLTQTGETIDADLIALITLMAILLLLLLVRGKRAGK